MSLSPEGLGAGVSAVSKPGKDGDTGAFPAVDVVGGATLPLAGDCNDGDKSTFPQKGVSGWGQIATD